MSAQFTMSDKRKIDTSRILQKLRNFLKNVTVEPAMLLDGLAFSIMNVFVDDLQMRRICEVRLEQNASVCSNLSNYQTVSDEVQVNFSVFAFYDGLIRSAIPLVFILFMGAWSDKYGRKVPLYTVQLGHIGFMSGLLIIALTKTLPVEFMLMATLVESLGGGNICFTTICNAYISDVTSEAARTARVGLANSLFFLGGPLGTYLGIFIYQYGGYSAIFGTSLVLNVITLLYIIFCTKESHGPYASYKFTVKNTQQALALNESLINLYGIDVKGSAEDEIKPEDVKLCKMITDFFNPQRIIESFKSTLKSREGNTRTLILLVIFSNLLRRLSRSPYVYAFTRHVLFWEVGDYSLWVTYKNLMATIGSLIAVPFLSGWLHVTDYLLGMVGALSNLVEYFLYGMVVFVGEYFFWIAPISAILINSCTIAQRSMLSKFVSSDELGKVSAVLGALDGLMPMITNAFFMAVYRETVTTFPAAHFFLGAAASAGMILIFLVIMALDRTKEYFVENAAPSTKKLEPVVSKFYLIRNDSRWLSSDFISMSILTPVLEASSAADRAPSVNQTGTTYLTKSGKLSVFTVSGSEKEFDRKLVIDFETKSQAPSEDSGVGL